MDNVQQEVDRLYKDHFGKMVASLLYFSRDIDLETAEDIVQDSFSAALSSWRKDGIPANPAGWLFRVCRNNALNKIKEGKKFTRLFETEESRTEEIKYASSILKDQQLRLLFASAHPDFAPKVQVVITLKYVVNLKVEAIARILAMSIDGVDKLLVRARQKIRDEKILLEEPSFSDLEPRLPIVHKIIYLVFNEGYKSSWGKEIIREELCEDALLMTKALIDSNIANKETQALYALMLFNAARFRARFGQSGELLDLESQDRELWNKDLIILACHFLKQCETKTISSYHYEAAIAYLHCMAKSFEETDWLAITNIYRQLLKNYPNPFVELNYAIALYYSGKRQNAMDILLELKQKPFLNQYYLLNATLGKIYFLEDNFKLAKEYFQLTLQQTNFQAEKEFIQKMIKKTEINEKAVQN